MYIEGISRASEKTGQCLRDKFGGKKLVSFRFSFKSVDFKIKTKKITLYDL